MAKIDAIIDLTSLGSVTHENFFLSTKATFTNCDQPKEVPNYMSEGGSSYWHGADEGGPFAIRQSDHWCQYYIAGTKQMKRFRARIRSCSWNIIIKKDTCDLNKEVERCGKCYLEDFERIIWKTKRRYESL